MIRAATSFPSMESATPLAPTVSPLGAVTTRAGAVMRTQGGASVAVHYGSAAAELGVCVRAVGLADRSDLGTLEIAGPAAAVGAFLRKLTGAPLEPAGVATAAGAWWCAAAPGRVLVLCEPDRRAQLLGVLRAASRRHPGVAVADVSSAWSAIAVVGRRTADVLAALGHGDDPRAAAPFGRASIGGAGVHVLLQSDRRAIVLAEPAAAGAVWQAIAHAGRPYGLSCVGTEAVERFALLDRPRVPRTPAR